MADISGLENLNYVQEYLYLTLYNTPNLDGLYSLQSVGGYLSLQKMFAVENIEGLSNLRNINGSLNFGNGPLLTSLHGLDSLLASTITSITFVGMKTLSDCAVKTICDFINLERPF